MHILFAMQLLKGFKIARVIYTTKMTLQLLSGAKVIKRGSKWRLEHSSEPPEMWPHFERDGSREE